MSASDRSWTPTAWSSLNDYREWDTVRTHHSSALRLPEHERDLTGGADPLARGERRLEAREGVI